MNDALENYKKRNNVKPKKNLIEKNHGLKLEKHVFVSVSAVYCCFSSFTLFQF